MFRNPNLNFDAPLLYISTSKKSKHQFYNIKIIYHFHPVTDEFSNYTIL